MFDYETEKIEDLKTHSEIHKRAEFKCNKCQEEFETQKKLEEHMQNHIQLLYLCDICDQRANSRDVYRLTKKVIMETKAQKITT